MALRIGHPDAVDPSWDDLRFLESLERLGSATAASRELGVAPSTIYRRVAALEEAAGVVCYSQREGGVTRVGRELAELARRTKSSLGRVLRQASEAQGAIRGKVTVTTLDGFAPLLSQPLATLSETHPEIELALDVSARGSSIRKGEADIALTSVDKPPRQLVGRKMFSAQCRVYGLPHLAEAWEDAPWVVLGPPLSASPIGRWERAQAQRSRVAVSTASRLTLNRLVAAGVGIGAIPELLAHEYPELVEVEALHSSTADLRLPVWLLTHPELRDTAAVRAVMTVLGDALAALGKTQRKTKRRKR
jgi:DNA-binding transcriptional LysR family regulator